MREEGAPLVMVRNRSCPAVSHICSLIHLLSSRIFFILKSMLRNSHTHSGLDSPVELQLSLVRRMQRTHPIVVMKLDVNESSEKRRSRQLLPTPAHSRSVLPALHLAA